MKDKIADLLLNLEAVKLSTDPPFQWISGILAPIYTDNRLLFSFPRERDFVIDCLVKTIKANKMEFHGIAGTATAGIPWASFLALKLNKPLIYVRKDSKDHGMQNMIEGSIEEEKVYLVVEDLISTGKSSIHTINEIRNENAIVKDCISIFTYELDSAKHNFELAQVNLSSLTTFTDLVKIAKNKDFISQEQLNHIMEWKDDPDLWGKN